MSLVEQDLLTASGSSTLSWLAQTRSGASEVLTSTGGTVLGSERREVPLEISATLGKQPWFNPILERLRGFLALSENWNGYGERTIHESTLRRVVEVLKAVCPEGPAPEVVPMSDGGVQIEWASGSYEIEIEVPSIGAAKIFLADPSGSEQEIEADSSSTLVWGLLRDCIADMKSDAD